MPLLIALLFLAVIALWLRSAQRAAALRRTAQQLEALRQHAGGRPRLSSPDDALEPLLAQVNALLDHHEQGTRSLRAQEEGLRHQIANISHDLRTPLTSILGYLQLLEEEGLPQGERLEYLRVIENRAQTLQTLIAAFYDLSRIEGGEYPLQREQVDLGRELGDLLVGVYNELEGAAVRVELEENLPSVWCDRNAVVRVLSNLLGNAMKHSPQGLWVRMHREGEVIVTSFANPAPALRQEDMPHIFDRFYTADQMRTGQNTGLGLAIVKALVTQMDHSVWARLEGGIFTIGVNWKI